MSQDAEPRREPRRRRDRRGRGGGIRWRTVAQLTAAALLGAIVVGAPLACGAVHRPVLLPLLGAVAALALLTAALAATSRSQLRPLPVAAFPLLFLFIAAAQLVPIPAGLRAALDPKGSELLALAQLAGAQPLSLDPPETYLRFALAAAALAVALAGFVMASRRQLRFVTPALVASAGLAALVIGLGHRAIAEDKIYGLFASSRGLPIGPFINPNHTAEFLELAAFAALAFAYSRPSLDGQRVWKILAAVLAAGALSTLSRGAILALGAGALTWFLLAPRSEDGEPLHRTKSAAVAIALVLVTGIAIAFGAEGLLDRFAEGGTGDARFPLWWDALGIVRAHPAGIGLGAFSRVYPAYRDIPAGAWHQFPENQPIGLLIEAGVAGALLFVGVWVLVVRRFARDARADQVEAALVAGLIAVLAHNLTDFGLETPGVLLPFVALVGTLFGRQLGSAEAPARKRATLALAGTAAGAVVAGTVLLLAPAARDFDALLASPTLASSAIAHAATRAHPTDYAYALAEARLTPTDESSASKRLRMLNRAIILCPRCAPAHLEAGRDLWRLGRRQQALLEWRTGLSLEPTRLASTVAELARAGAKPPELGSLATEKNRHELSRLLLSQGLIDAAREVLLGGETRPNIETHLVEAQIDLQANDLTAARAAAQRAAAAAPRDPRTFAIAADVETRANDRDKALAIVADGLRIEPMNVDLNRRHLDLLMQTDRWRDTDRALESLRQAIGHAGASMLEANLAAARIFQHRGQFQRALAEFQSAASQFPDDAGLQLGLARAAEQAGRVTEAIDAYNAVLRKTPGHPEASAALTRIRQERKSLEILRALPAPAALP